METTCEIEFENNPAKVFYSGTVLRGVATLSLPSARTVNSIYFHFDGRAAAQWVDYGGEQPVSHTGKETYLNRKLFIEQSEHF